MLDWVVLSIMRVLIVLIGLFIAYKSIILYRAIEDQKTPFLFLATGLTIFTIGVTVEGILELLDYSLNSMHMFEGILSIVGFLLIIQAINLMTE